MGPLMWKSKTFLAYMLGVFLSLIVCEFVLLLEQPTLHSMSAYTLLWIHDGLREEYIYIFFNRLSSLKELNSAHLMWSKKWTQLFLLSHRQSIWNVWFLLERCVTKCCDHVV